MVLLEQCTNQVYDFLRSILKWGIIPSNYVGYHRTSSLSLEWAFQRAQFVDYNSQSPRFFLAARCISINIFRGSIFEKRLQGANWILRKFKIRNFQEVPSLLFEDLKTAWLQLPVVHALVMSLKQSQDYVCCYSNYLQVREILIILFLIFYNIF